ncbi:MAG: glycosyltransferase family 2 protein, partial [Deltaproteobacteria bacterium]|nr:glycosyltransferase family 2 protein [Deltaproteobacteria bacterium]
ANNQGIKKASGKYILTLNNDTVLGKGFLGALAAAAESSVEDAGMWAVKILSFDEQVVIDSVGGLLIYPDGLARGRGRLEKDTGQYDVAGAAFIPSACAGLYRRSMLEEVGLFDEDFFAYCEDTDLGFRARLAGWKTVSVPGAVVYHHYSGTGGRYTPFKAYLVERNRIWVALKNFPLRFLLLSPFYTGWRYVMQVYGILTGKGAGGRFVEGFSKAGLLKVLIKAYVDAFKALPRVLAKRRAIRKKRAVSAKTVGSWFKAYGISAKELALKD